MIRSTVVTNKKTWCSNPGAALGNEVEPSALTLVRWC